MGRALGQFLGRFLETLKWQFAEEWRIHTLLFGRRAPFILFPAAIFSVSLILSLFFSVFLLVIPARSFFLGVSGFCLLLGFSVGAFGLFGREILNRRFGQASLVSYSSRILPVSDRTIFLSFILKDSVYYLLLWLAPALLGLGLGLRSFFLLIAGAGGLPLPGLIQLIADGSVVFLLGMSLSFFLSGVFVRSKLAFLATALGAFLASFFAGFGVQGIVGSISVFPDPLLPRAGGVLLAILALSTGGLLLLESDYYGREAALGGKGGGRSSGIILKAPAGLVFAAKDLLDLRRSGGGLGRVVFAFLVPLWAVWYLLSKLSGIAPELPVFLAFSVFAGVISSSMYNWLTEFDFPAAYSFLPVRISQLIRGKLAGYLLLNILPLAIVAGAGLALAIAPLELLEAILAALIFSAYSLAVTVFLTGLEPSMRLYGGGNFLRYALLISLPSALFVFLSLGGGPVFLGLRAGLLVFLVPASAILLRASLKKWESWEIQFF